MASSSPAAAAAAETKQPPNVPQTAPYAVERHGHRFVVVPGSIAERMVLTGTPAQLASMAHFMQLPPGVECPTCARHSPPQPHQS